MIEITKEPNGKVGIENVKFSMGDIKFLIGYALGVVTTIVVSLIL